jgi:hypothetical protein
MKKQKKPKTTKPVRTPTIEEVEVPAKFKLAKSSLEASDGTKFFEISAIVPVDIKEEASKELEQVFTQASEGYKNIVSKYFQ